MKINKKKQITRLLIVIMMVLSSMTMLAIFTSNVAATSLGSADVTISVVGDSKLFHTPGNWVSFTLKLQNDNSNTDAWVNLTLEGGTTHPRTGENWNSSLEKDNNIVVLDTGRTTNVRLDVRVGKEIFNASSKAGHVERVTIKGEYYDKGDQTYTPAGTLSQTVDVEVLQVWKFEFENKAAEPTTKKPNAAGSVRFNFTINNTGNGEDTFTFKVTGAPGTPFITTTDVNAYAIKDHTMFINNIKDNVEAGYHAVTVEAQSENTSIAARQAAVIVQIDPSYNLDLSSNEPTTKNIEPGEAIIYNFTVKNKGNDDDQIIRSATIVGSAPGWTADIPFPSNSYTIDRNDSVNLQLEITAPPNATYPTTVQVSLNVSSKNDPKVFQLIDSIKAKIVQISVVDIIPTFTQRQINKTTHKASYPIDVRNKGNGEDTIELELFGKFPAGESWNYVFNPPSVTLGAKGSVNQNRTVYFNVTAPEDAKFGDIYVKINATSEQDPNEMDQKELQITVGKSYNIDIIRLASEKQSAYPGEMVSIQIRGENIGNFKDTFDFDDDVPPTAVIGWTTDFDPDILLNLEPNAVGFTYYNVTVDDNAPQGNYIFKIKCNSGSDKESPLKDTFLLNISVQRKYEVQLNLVSEPLFGADPGSSADFLFSIQNKGTGSCNVTMEATMDAEPDDYLNVQITPSSFELPTETSVQSIWVNVTPSVGNPLAPMNLSGVPINIEADIVERDGGPEDSEEIEVRINQSYDVDVYVSELYKNIEPGNSEWVIITVTNDGNGIDSYQISPTPPARAGWNTKATPTSTGLLAMGESKEINITISVPSTESVVTDNITINVTSIGDQSIFMIKLVKIIVEETKNAKFTGTDSRKEVEPGSFVHFTVEIENTGTVDDIYELDVIDEPEDIDFELGSPLNVKAKQRNSTILNITVSDSDVENLPSMINITVEASNKESVIIQKIFTIDITEVRGVSISSSPNWQKGKPKETLTYNLSIENTGTGDDRFALSILPNLPYSGWANLKNIGDYTPSLAPGEQTYVEVDVEIPAKRKPGEGAIFILAESKENPDKTDIVNFTLSIEQVYKLQITLEPTKLEVNPGENVTFIISIKNTGTGLDNVSIDKSYTDNGESILKSELSERFITLNPSQTKTVSFNVEAIDEPEADKLTAKINIEVQSEEDISDPVASDSEEITLDIKPTVDVELEMVGDQKKDVTPELSGTEAEVEYTIKIWNRGLGKDSFEITEMNNHGFKVDIDPRTTNPIDAGASTSVTVKIIVNNKAPKTSSDYNTTITVTSKENDQKFESIILKTRILQTYGVELQTNDKTAETEETLIGNNRVVNFNIDVRNLGTGEDTIKFELSGDYVDWATLNESSVDLDTKFNKRKSFSIEVRVPRETLEGNYDIILQAISRGDDDKYSTTDDEFDEIKLTVKVTQFYEVALDPGETIKSGLPGDTIDFTFTVVNRGNGEDTVELKKTNFDLDWLWTLSPKSPTLQPTGDALDDDRKEVKVSVDIPTDKHGEAGLYILDIFVSSNPIGGEKITHNANQPLTFTVKVDAEYDTDIILDYPTSADDQKAEPGETIDYKVTLKNKGNTIDTFKLTVTGSKSGWVNLERTSVTVGAFRSTTVNFTVEIPELSDVDAEDIEAQKYQIKLRATSEGDGDIYDELTINPTVDEEYVIELEAFGDDILVETTEQGSITANPNADPEYSTFSLTITNKGNTLDRVTLSTKNTGSWIIKYKTSSQTSTSLSISIAIGRSDTITVQVFPPSDADNEDTRTFTIEAKSDNGKVTDTYRLKGTVETADIAFGDLNIDETTAGSKATIKLIVKNDGDVDAEDIEVKFYDKSTLIHTEKIDTITKRDEVEVQFTYDIEEGDHKIEAQTPWSDKTVKKSQSFSSEAELLSADMFWIIIIIVAVVVFIVGIALASASYRSGIPADLREEIALAKQAKRMGKSPDEIRDMRMKKYERFTPETKRSGLKSDKEAPAMEDESEKPRKRGSGKVTRIKCPKCDRVQTVTSTKRPIEFPCSNCGMKLVLKK
jgi:uncharacterized membrane protein/ribosomal protein S27E